MTTFSVDTSELGKAIEDAKVLPFSDLQDALGEGITSFKDKLRGTGQRPGNPWPIGTVRKSKKSGRNYYVPMGSPGSRRSGRSLRGWKSRQRGISAVVFNDARASKGGGYYAQYIHLAGGEAGDAAEAAEEIFSEEMDKVAAKMITLLRGGLLGG